jgi:hypothetical protein
MTRNLSWLEMQQEKLQEIMLIMRKALPEANMEMISEVHHNNPSSSACAIRLYTGLGHIDFNNHQEWLAFVGTIAMMDLHEAVKVPVER